MFALPGNPLASLSLYNTDEGPVCLRRVSNKPEKVMDLPRSMCNAAGKSSGQTGTRFLLEAMSKDQVHLARFVLDALDGEIVDSQTEGALTPLISSILLPDDQSRCKFVEMLLQRGASVNCQDAAGRTALSHACENGYLDAVKVLVQHNADPEIEDSWGNTALMYAAVAGHSAVVEFLVRAFKRLGLQIDRQNRVGNSAAEVAKVLGHTECFFALTHNSKRGREADENPQLTLEEDSERKIVHLGNKLELLQTCNRAQCLLVGNCTRQPRPRIMNNRFLSMDSIEEFGREDDGRSSPSSELLCSWLPVPAPTMRSQSPKLKYSKASVRLVDDHLPPLMSNREEQKSLLFSPRPTRNSNKPKMPSALEILLTPKCVKELRTEHSKPVDLSQGTFHESYYKKRCSLPSSIFSPTPPEQALVPVRKSRTVRRREASTGDADPLRVFSPAQTSAATTFTVLSNKLLSRFTSPEFKKCAKDQERNSEFIAGRIPRSETFPQSIKHPEVDCKASIDSISSVKCEFDFNSKK